MNERMETFFVFNPSGALISSLTVMVLVAILMTIVGIMARRQDPLKPSKGLLMFAEFLYEKVTNWMKANMGEGWESFTGYFMALWSYLFIALPRWRSGFESRQMHFLTKRNNTKYLIISLMRLNKWKRPFH